MNKFISSLLKVKNDNNIRMKRMLDDVSASMRKQGNGCYSEGYGVLYMNARKGTRDPISHLLKIADAVGYYGPIGAPNQAPLINKISKYYGCFIGIESERNRLVRFLTDIQDAHDDVFCPFIKNKHPDPMNNFLLRCMLIGQKIGI